MSDLVNVTHEAEVTTASLALILGMTERRVGQLVSQGVIPKAGRGRFVLVDALRAYHRHLSESSSGQRNEVAQELEKVRLRRAQRADALEAGSVLSREQVDETMSVILAETVGLLDGIPSRCGATREIRDRINREIRDVRRNIATRLEAIATGRDSSSSIG